MLGGKKRHRAFLILWQLKSALWSKYGLCGKWREANCPVFQISGKSFSQTNRITHHKECLKLCCFICQQIKPWKKETEWTVSRRRKWKRLLGGCIWPIIYKRKIPLLAVCLEQTLWQNLTDRSLTEQNPSYLQEFDWCTLKRS